MLYCPVFRKKGKKKKENPTMDTFLDDYSKRTVAYGLSILQRELEVG